MLSAGRLVSGFAFACCSLFLVLSGCAGPKFIRYSQARYNEAVQLTGTEELLLNLVRLRYGESVKFMPITSITDQLEIDGRASFSGGIDQDFPTRIGGGELLVSDRPTLTFDPRRSPEMTEALLTYVDVETLELLDGAGWDVERMFRLLVESINGVGNAVTGDGPTPCQAPEFADYKYLVGLMKSLHDQGHLTFGEEHLVADLDSSVAFHSANAEALLSAHKEGFGVRQADHGYVFTRTEKVRSLRFATQANSADLNEILRILRLPAGPDFYPILWSEGGQLRSVDPAQVKAKVTISTRSPLEAMYFLSHAITVPSEHVERGLVTVTRNPDGSAFDWAMVTGDLLRVCVSDKKPKHAAVAVRYRDHWFYVRDSDTASKNTLSLFRELMRLQKGGGSGDSPVLTLPVGGRR